MRSPSGDERDPRGKHDGHNARGESGGVTAEFAVVLPAILLVVVTVVGLLGVAGDAIRLADAAGVVARATGRGDDGLAAAAVHGLAPGASVSVVRGDLVCVRLTRSLSIGPVSGRLAVSARSCAPAEGR